VKGKKRMSETTSWVRISDMAMFKTLEHLIDDVWRIVSNWRGLARDTVGTQLVRAADSVGANLVEGDARFTFKDKLNYCYIARASLAETRYWIERANTRRLLVDTDGAALLQTCDALLHWINTLISQRRHWMNQVRDEAETYGEPTEV
jgi:four helix bundle protein